MCATHSSGATNALMGMFGLVQRVDVPESDLIVPLPLPGSLILSPTLAFALTQCCPSAPVIESVTAPTTLPGMKMNQHPCSVKGNTKAIESFHNLFKIKPLFPFY